MGRGMGDIGITDKNAILSYTDCAGTIQTVQYMVTRHSAELTNCHHFTWLSLLLILSISICMN